MTSKLKPAHQILGQRGEDLAVNFLKSAKMTILARNWRPERKQGAMYIASLHSLELDIVALDGNTLVFAEVKSRILKPHTAFTALDNFSYAKQKRLRKAVALYLTQTESWKKPCRFDLICVNFSENASENVKVEHYQNVLAE
jgi:putative endonuclease